MKSRLMPLAAAVLTLAAGCAPHPDRIESGAQDNARGVALLRAEQARLQQDISAVTSLLRLDQESGTETSAQRLAKLSQFSSRLDRIIQKLDDNAEFIRRLSARVDLLADRAGVPRLGESSASPSSGGGDAASLPEEGRAIFQAAQLDRSRGNNELAREGLREFLEKYGRSELADDALYWLGDLAYGEGHHEEALGHFRNLMTRFPLSDQAAAGMLKGALCQRELGRRREARRLLERLVDEYPDTAEAGLAQERLQEWGAD